MTSTFRLIVSADDFGRDVAVNEAVEIAHRDGILSTASLMVAAPAAADAVACAQRLPNLRVGLHLVLIDGVAVSPAADIRGLVDAEGRFGDNQGLAGFRYFFVPGMRRRLAAEIRAQFEAFRATGLALDHVNAHKHMHLHPTVARLIIEIGRDYGMHAMRVPDEPVEPLRRALPGEPVKPPAYRPVVTALRRRLRRAGIAANDHVFGVAWSGAMTEQRLLALLPCLPPGVSELYSHPASRTTPALATGMPGYRHAEELAALVSPNVRRRVAELGIELIGYRDLVPDRSVG
ncbi:MAG TPA: hopanoid biosynthesis-associated protein HpnK [Stellaceae bacterium]|nr:hopanoid biosynthesis-associated protein HpnK [Stellaceae bacterium]